MADVEDVFGGPVIKRLASTAESIEASVAAAATRMAAATYMTAVFVAGLRPFSVAVRLRIEVVAHNGGPSMPPS